MQARIVPAVLLAATAVTTQPSLENRIDAAIQGVAREVPGLALTMVSGGDTVYAKGFGSASLTGTKPITPDTQFRIASVSKPITAVAIFKLVEQGRVALDRPAKDYCAALAPLDGSPTVRHFLTHRSGMRHTNDEEDEHIVGAPASLGASLARIVKERLRFPPGSKTNYTSWGYTALGCVIESVSGQPYATFIREQILTPAGMTSTAFDEPGYAAAQFSPGYRRDGSGFAPSVVVDTRFKTPASGIISTTNDLTRFAQALMNGRLLSPPLFQQMLAPPGGAEPPTFTAGWTIGPSNLGTPGYNYNGSMEGTTAMLLILPERRIAVALLTNRERFVPGVSPVAGEALRAVLGLPPK